MVSYPWSGASVLNLWQEVLRLVIHGQGPQYSTDGKMCYG